MLYVKNFSIMFFLKGGDYTESPLLLVLGGEPLFGYVSIFGAHPIGTVRRRNKLKRAGKRGRKKGNEEKMSTRQK
jgi:hypothetical protein